MTLWCLSGFVMLYQSYPELSGAERRAGLAPLDLTQCCELGALAASPEAVAPGFRVEMLRGAPVLRLGGGGRGGRASESAPAIIDLRTGLPVSALSSAEVLEVAAHYGRGNGIEGLPRLVGPLEVDQWTIQSARRNQPAYHVAFDDPAGHEIYVSGASGEVFQDTNRRERILSWLGAIPHWLYPLALRRNGPLWTEIVVWTSVVGTFLAATGLYVGIARFKRRGKDKRFRSPFRGWWYWHHMTGLVFGALTLTWVFSGLMTMSPWGVLDGGGAGGGYTRTIAGEVTWGEVERFLAAAAADPERFRGFRELEPAPFGGELHVLAHAAEGAAAVRFDAAGRPATVGVEQIELAAASLAAPVREISVLDREDSYYYGHKNPVELPVYRLLVDDADATRLYVSPSTGGVRAVDATRRLSRWIRTGLHGLDFPVLRIRPIWDVVVVLLLLGVTTVCATGSWMAVKRVGRDYRVLRVRLRRFLYRKPLYASSSS
jgi:hypothetical protein